MESEAMQEAFHLIHAHKNCKCDRPEHWEQDETIEDCLNQCSTFCCCQWTCTNSLVNTNVLWDDQVEEYFGKLSMGKWESPESEVRSSVRDSSKNELDGLNHLMNEGFTKGVVVIWNTHFLKNSCNSSYFICFCFHWYVAVILDSSTFFFFSRTSVVIIFFEDLV